jgi:hypothetical protein
VLTRLPATSIRLATTGPPERSSVVVAESGAQHGCGATPAEFPDPVWTIAGDVDDIYERLYDPKERLRTVRDIGKTNYFTGVCGRYRFNRSALPDVSVIITTQNEQEDMLTMSVHSV